MEAKQRDSVGHQKVLTAWLQTMERDRGLAVLDEEFLRTPTPPSSADTLDGHGRRVRRSLLMDQLINRQRESRSVGRVSRLGMFLDEDHQHAFAWLPQYIAESRGPGRSRCVLPPGPASNFDAIYGPLRGAAIRAVVPASLLMYGSGRT